MPPQTLAHRGMGWKERDGEVMHLDAEGNRDAAVVALLLTGGGLVLRQRPSLGRRGLGQQPGVAGCWGDGGLGRQWLGGAVSVGLRRRATGATAWAAYVRGVGAVASAA